MKKFLLLLLVVWLGTPAYAQWEKSLRTVLPALRRAIVKPVGVSQRQLEKALLRAEATASSMVAGTEKALIPLRENNLKLRLFRVPGTAFMIEETHKGKKQLWGISATHYGYEQPAIPTSRFSRTALSFSAQGNDGANDVSVFPIPQELSNTFKPLKLAPHAPQVGEEVFSLSFFDKKFQVTPRRTVLETTPMRIIVSGEIYPEICREGECGSPLINQKGEVVGMIVGVSYSQQIGYAVPVENIHDILKALHQQGQLYKPVLVHGREIIQLNVDEAIVQVTVTQHDNTSFTRVVYHHEKELDIAHLENFVDLSQAKELTLVIEKSPFSSAQQDRKRHAIHVVHDLQTGATRLFPIE